jgi:hypothetical protein
MKSILIAGAAFVASAIGTQVKTSAGNYGHGYGQNVAVGHSRDTVTYDYTCKAKHDENCLQNDITLYGPKVVLVNLDNRCQIEKLENEGIFVQTGDLIFVTGREDSCAW